MRTGWLLRAVVLVLAGTGCTARAANEVVMDQPTRRATARALSWLASQQNANGSWSETGHPESTAITSFALLAFLSQGHLPGQGQYGPEVARGARFLLTSARGSGYLVGPRGGNMYSHGMATLALAELWGMTSDRDIRPILSKAVNLIVGTQNAEGGWRYDPAPTGADISVTIIQVMALRAAKNCGLLVPDQTMRKAIAYIKSCHDPRTGGFCYQPHRIPGFSRTAAGACVLQLTGEYRAAEIPRAIDYLEQNYDTHEHFWYGHYYASHAMHQVGGKPWKSWYERERTFLLDTQLHDGRWIVPRHNEVGPVYQTSIAVIILSVPMSYMAIYQR